MNLLQATALGFRGYFDFKGRASQGEFWYFVVFLYWPIPLSS